MDHTSDLRNADNIRIGIRTNVLLIVSSILSIIIYNRY
jgi:hypothetical protein